MRVGDQNPWDDFKAEHDDDRKPTLRSLISGYLMALILILIASVIAGIFLLLNGFRHAGLSHYNDHDFIWAAVFVIGGAVVFGIGFWLTAVWEEIQTRHHLERHTQEVEEHLRAKENDNSFSRLFDERERRERESSSKSSKASDQANRAEGQHS